MDQPWRLEKEDIKDDFWVSGLKHGRITKPVV